jgi:hypothetical protein
VSADSYPVHTLRQCCKTFRCRVALPFPFETIRAPYGFVVASLLVALVCFSRVPYRQVRFGALPNTHGFSSALSGVVAPSLSDHDALSLTVWTECETCRKLSGFIAAGDRESQRATIEGVF